MLGRPLRARCAVRRGRPRAVRVTGPAEPESTRAGRGQPAQASLPWAPRTRSAPSDGVLSRSAGLARIPCREGAGGPTPLGM